MPITVFKPLILGLWVEGSTTVLPGHTSWPGNYFFANLLHVYYQMIKVIGETRLSFNGP